MEPIQFAIVLVVGSFLLAGLWWISRRSSGYDRAYYQKRWSKVTKTATDGKSGMRLSIVDADKLLDHALKAGGYKGVNMGERLRSAESALGSNYQNIWDAHKLRNRLVHEEVKLKENDFRHALNSFQRGLKDLGAL